MIRRLELEKNRRVIAVSDFHGNLDMFKRLIEKVGFCDGDYLFIVGDTINRGKQSLASLRYMMELTRRDNVFMVRGNHEHFMLMMIRTDSEDSQFMRFARRIPSLLMDMLAALDIDPDAMPLDEIKQRLNESFKAELDFIDGLPFIIDTQQMTFVHGGLGPGSLEGQNFVDCLRRDGFLDHPVAFEKYVVAGHWPTTLYQKKYVCHNIVYEHNKKIIAIDGGLQIKTPDGQLNALIADLSGKRPKFSQQYVEDVPYVRVRKSQPAMKATYMITWVSGGEIVLLERGEQFSLCEVIKTGLRTSLPTKMLMHWDDKFYAPDISDYCLPVSEGELVGLVCDCGCRFLAKKDGVVGWVNSPPVYEKDL